MAGKACPSCGQFTFHKSATGRLCSKCGHKMVVPPNDGKGGRGNTCSNCGKMQVFGNKCRGCGATYSGGTKG